MVAGRRSYRGYRFPSLACPLHSRYILVHYMDPMDFILSILSITPGDKSREEISSYIKEERINFSVHVVIFLNIELSLTPTSLQ